MLRCSCLRPIVWCPDLVRVFRSSRSLQGLTLGECLRLGENDPTSATAEPATVFCCAGSPYIPDLHHSQTSALAPIPALFHIRMLTGQGGRVGGGGRIKDARLVVVRREIHPSIRLQEGIRSDAARPRPGESARHIWNCRFDLPSSHAVPPRRPYKERAGRWGFLGETPVATNQGYRFAASRPHPALKWENASLI